MDRVRDSGDYEGGVNIDSIVAVDGSHIMRDVRSAQGQSMTPRIDSPPNRPRPVTSSLLDDSNAAATPPAIPERSTYVTPSSHAEASRRGARTKDRSPDDQHSLPNELIFGKKQ